MITSPKLFQKTQRTAVRRVRRRAFTLTEMAIVLGIVGLVIAAIWVAANSVMQQNNVNQTVQEVIAVVTSAKMHYRTQGYFCVPGGPPCTLTQEFIYAGIVPPGMVLQIACPGVGWGPPCVMPTSGVGGPWAIYSNSGEYTAPTVGTDFEILMGGSFAQCGQLLTQIIAQSQNTGLVWFYADGVGAMPVTSTTSPTVGANCTGNIVVQYKLWS